jgi:hypothetical protein
MKINNYKILIPFLILFACSQCTTKVNGQNTEKVLSMTDYNKLKDYLHTLSNKLSITNYDAVIFISDKEGGCYSCLKSFSNFVCQELLNQDRILLILNAKGLYFNIAPYLSDTVKNVLTDYSNDFFYLKISTSPTSIIVVEDNDIANIYPVTPETLSENMTLLVRMKYSSQKQGKRTN